MFQLSKEIEPLNSFGHKVTLGCLSNEHHYIYFYLLPFLFVFVEAWQNCQVNPKMAARTELAQVTSQFPCSKRAGQVFNKKGVFMASASWAKTGSRSRQKKNTIHYPPDLPPPNPGCLYIFLGFAIPIKYLKNPSFATTNWHPGAPGGRVDLNFISRGTWWLYPYGLILIFSSRKP